MGLEPSVSIPVLSLQDQATGSGGTTGILNGSSVLTRKHQRFIDTGREIGEGIRNLNRVPPGFRFGCSLNGGKSSEGANCKARASKESHLDERLRPRWLSRINSRRFGKPNTPVYIPLVSRSSLAMCSRVGAWRKTSGGSGLTHVLSKSNGCPLVSTELFHLQSLKLESLKADLSLLACGRVMPLISGATGKYQPAS